jgi:hypothetical protein
MFNLEVVLPDGFQNQVGFIAGVDDNPNFRLLAADNVTIGLKKADSQGDDDHRAFLLS